MTRVVEDTVLRQICLRNPAKEMCCLNPLAIASDHRSIVFANTFVFADTVPIHTDRTPDRDDPDGRFANLFLKGDVEFNNFLVGEGVRNSQGDFRHEYFQNGDLFGGVNISGFFLGSAILGAVAGAISGGISFNLSVKYKWLNLVRTAA